jgi:hypothetical protein
MKNIGPKLTRPEPIITNPALHAIYERIKAGDLKAADEIADALTPEELDRLVELVRVLYQLRSQSKQTMF